MGLQTQSAYGERETFRIVFETGQLRQDGKPYLLFSRGFTPSLHEKATLRQFLKQWFGRDLTAAEQDEFDTEALIGRPARVPTSPVSSAPSSPPASCGCGRGTTAP